MKRAYFLIAFVLFLAILAFFFYRYKRESTPNVIVITLDTLRADHLGCYGYSRPTSPNLDRIASQGILFENFFTTIPQTLPAHASLFFGTWPRLHGSTNNHTEFSNPSLVFLPVLMHKAGFVTGAFTSIFHLTREFKRFGGFDSENAPEVVRNVDSTLPLAMQWLGQQHGKFFAWIHIWDCHAPYYLHPTFMKKINADFHDDSFEQIHGFFKPERYNPDQMKAMIDLYDNEIAYVDSWLGKFFDEFQKNPKYNNTLLIITADHGESMDEVATTEHYAFNHGEYLFDFQVHIPMIIIPPRNSNAPRGLRVKQPASMIDIAPTILEYVHLPAPSVYVGKSLTAYFDSAKANLFADRAVFLQRRTFKKPPRPFLQYDEYGIKNDRFKLLMTVPDQLAALYRNGSETALQDAQTEQLMKNRLLEWLKNNPDFTKKSNTISSPEEEEKLRSLGYVQ